MSPSRPFILRPVATSLLMVGLMLAGIVAYTQLPVSALPEVDYPTIRSRDVLSRSKSGRDGIFCDRAARASIRPDPRIESNDLHELVRQFDHHAAVRPRLEHRCGRTGSAGGHQRGLQLLPPNLPNPPIYDKINPADTPILTLALTSHSLPLTNVEDLADTNFAQKISQLTGVGLVSISGGQRPAVRVQANPRHSLPMA